MVEVPELSDRQPQSPLDPDVGGQAAPDLGEQPRGLRRRVVVGGAWNTFAWIVVNGCGAAITILLVRTMTHSQYGIWVLATSAIGIASALAAFGLGPALVQLAPHFGDKGAAFVLRPVVRVAAVLALVAALSVGLAAVALQLSGSHELALTVAVLAPTAVAAPFAVSMSGFLQSAHQPRRLALATLAGPVLLTAAVVALAIIGHPSADLVAAVRLGSVMAGTALLVLVVHRSGGRLRAATAEGSLTSEGGELRTRRIIVLGGSLLTGTVFTVLLAQLDVLVLGAAHGHRAAAFYGPISQIADNALTMTATVGVFYLPTIARLLTTPSMDHAADMYRWASRWAFVWVAPAMAVIFACPSAALSLLFGSSYAGMALPLRILGVGVLANVLFGFNGPTVDSLNRARLILTRQSVGVGVNVVACAVLIPPFGIDGAAVATASSLVCINLATSWLLVRETGISPKNAQLFAVACSLAATVGFGVGVSGVAMPDAVRVLLVAAVAFALCGATSYVVSGEAERLAIRSGTHTQLARLRGSLRRSSASRNLGGG